MKRVAIVGIGQSKFGRRIDVNVNELAFEAIREALLETGLSQRDIEIVSVGTVGSPWSEELLPAVTVTDYAGLYPAGVVRCEAACSTGSAAFNYAYSAVAGGVADVAMAVGVEKMSEVDTATAVEVIGRSGSYLWEFENFGMTFPGYYAMHAVAHMAEFGTTVDQLAMVAVKNHKYGAMNPLAHIQKEITIDDVLNSRVIAWPLKLYDCCPISDGSAAVILASEDRAAEITDTPIWVKGLGMASGSANLSKRKDFVGLKATVLASRKAYKMADIEPEDVDVAVVHDCFTIAEILAYEDLGFCGKGEGGNLIEEGETYIGGKIPVNIDGGLKAKGHPLGATGCSMVYEIVKQLRSQAGKRQASLKKGIGLVHNVGGTGHFCYVTVLSG